MERKESHFDEGLGRLSGLEDENSIFRFDTKRLKFNDFVGCWQSCPKCSDDPSNRTLKVGVERHSTRVQRKRAFRHGRTAHLCKKKIDQPQDSNLHPSGPDRALSSWNACPRKVSRIPRDQNSQADLDRAGPECSTN